MKDERLEARARARGVATVYTDWRGRETKVSPETLRAVLDSLGTEKPPPRLLPEFLVRSPGDPRPITVPWGAKGPHDLWLDQEEWAGELRGTTARTEDGLVRQYRVPATVPLGWHRIRVRGNGQSDMTQLLVAPARLPEPPRAWGLTAQLYSLTSRGSWGMGDLRDLADLATWAGRDTGAGFVLVNPLHATEPVPPIGASPYSPMSRRFPSPLYLRVEDVPEFASLPKGDREDVAALAAAARAHDESIDRDAVWAAKREALELLHLYSDDRGTAFDDFLTREGKALTSFATWCALAEKQGTADWRRWPAELHDPAGTAVAAAAKSLARRVDFHLWVQWRLDEQLAAAQRAAREAGMPIGIVHDLAVGVHPGSADTWIFGSMFAPGMSVGAPPDEFNQRGQDWGQPPWHPERLAEAAYGPFRAMVGAALRHGGGLRLDHAMQISRLWWVPEGGSPADGTYVRYDRDALLSCLVWEAHWHGGVIIGEDLGTVEPEVRDDLADRGVLGTSLLWFERDQQGRPRPPEFWREASLATVGTHDMPPITGFLHGDHIELRDRLGLLTRSSDEEAADHRRQLAEWLSMLQARGLLSSLYREDEDVVRALHAFLTLTPARLIGISLADAVGERRTQNQPGTVDEYPNWRVPLADADGMTVQLEDLASDPRVRAALAPLSGQSGREPDGHAVQEVVRHDLGTGDHGEDRGQAR
ncbi:4-alpha-glucanotransferase [Spirillospora sp. CA-294931]|uniref:4-alpha-glucanotransferase n=1 Tax=Spirillospora sp. CA-294931 TaxID=3240042 RepID=UPI003D8A5A85